MTIGLLQNGGPWWDGLIARATAFDEFVDGKGWMFATAVVAYIYATVRYAWLAHRARSTVNIAPISVRGGISEKLGSQEAGFTLCAQLEAVRDAFRQQAGKRGPAHVVPSVEPAFPTLDAALETAELETEAPAVQVREDLTVKWGGVLIPIGAMIMLFRQVAGSVWTPWRNAYLSSRIHVSLVSIGDTTQLIVARGRRPKRSADDPAAVGHESVTARIELRETKTVAQLVDLLQDAAFLVLELHGQSFPNRHARSVRWLADMLLELDEYRRSGDPKRLDNATDAAIRAAAADPRSVEGQYFAGSLLLYRRKADSIPAATDAFESALAQMGDERLASLDEVHRKKRLKLRALCHAGLAHCYGQRVHRLAQRGDHLLREINEHAVRALSDWHDADAGKPLLWIEVALNFRLHADEGTADDRDEVIPRFTKAARRYHRLLRRFPDNGHVHNNLGWLLLKLAEWDVQEIPDAPEGLQGPTALLAEQHLRRAVEGYDANKLVHANLCLVYAMPLFRHDDADRNLQRSRFHGQNAVRLDPTYINGWRDLGESMMRYRAYDEAYRAYTKALEHALTIEKDIEIMDRALEILEDQDAPADVRTRFRDVPLALLEPPGAETNFEDETSDEEVAEDEPAAEDKPAADDETAGTAD